MPSTDAMRSTNASSTGPERTRGGAANANRSPVVRIVMSPAAHSCTVTSSRFGWPPDVRQAWHVPSVGWPANGSSRTGVKMRTR